MRAVAAYIGYRTEVNPESRESYMQSLEVLARVGEPFAQGVIGYLTYQGELAGPVLRPEALQMMWTSIRSKTPFAHAYAPLGVAFIKGAGVEKDEEIGRTLLKRGVEHGSGAAMFEVGQLVLEETPSGGDLSEAQRWASLAQSYGEAKAARLIRAIEAREEKHKQEQLVTERRRIAQVARERDEKSRNELAQRAHRQLTAAGTTLAETFRGTAKFLGELLEIGAVVGIAVLMVTAGGHSAGGASAPSAIYYAPPAVHIARPQVIDRSALLPIGMPVYSAGQVVYSPSDITRRPIGVVAINAGQVPKLLTDQWQDKPPQISSVQIRAATLDPTRTIRAQVESDGSFRGRSIDGDQVRGYIRSSGGRTEVEMRQGLGSDPTTTYRGTGYGSNSTITLNNPYTGSRVTGAIGSSGDYRVR
jgi:hypothetical protein